MDTNIAFSRPQAPIPRPRPAHGGVEPGSRQSNALRASVLDVALELGIGSSSLVANWMFDNPLMEEDEEEASTGALVGLVEAPLTSSPLPDQSTVQDSVTSDAAGSRNHSRDLFTHTAAGQVSSPGLTFGSSATSEESSFSAPQTQNHVPLAANASGAGVPFTFGPSFKAGVGPLIFQRKEFSGSGISNESIALERVESHGLRVSPTGGISFSEIPIPPRPTTPGGSRKLKKKNKIPGDAGYESDGGYMSETGKKKKKTDKKAEGVANKTGGSLDGHQEKIEAKEAKLRLKEEKASEKKEKEDERKRKKSLVSAAKATKKAEGKQPFVGYDTDGGGIGSKPSSKSKSKKRISTSGGDVGYETDSGYQSVGNLKKSKSRFFKLTSKSSRTDLRREEEAAPALPIVEKEPVILKIAQRFATTLSPTTSLSPSGPESPTPNYPVVALPSTHVGTPLPLPLPDLSFQPFSASPSPEPSTTPTPVLSTDTNRIRDSLSSAESGFSNSSGPRRGLSQFWRNSHSESASGHHTNESFSTVNSSSHGGTNGHKTTVPSPISPSLRSASSMSSLKPPIISFPLTRTPSPMQPGLPSGPAPPPTSSSAALLSALFPTSSVAPLNITKGPRTRPSLDNLHVSSLNASPSPISPHSPYVVVTPMSVNSPAMNAGSSHSHSYSPSPSPVPRSRNPSADGHGARSPLGQPTPQSPPRLVIPSSDYVPSSSYVVPSPRNSSLHSPNVLAYYDIPAPSPPPMGPLPSVPLPVQANANSNAGIFPSPAALRQRLAERPATKPSYVYHDQNGYLQRGKEAPFPARPVLPTGTLPGSAPQNGNLDMEARVARRYRELYTPPGASDSDVREEKEKAGDVRRARLAGNHRTEPEKEAFGDEEEDMRDILERFEDRSSESADSHNGRALGRSRSFEALKERQSFAVSEYYGSRRDREFDFEDGRTVGDRNSRWSGSIYSRLSILDEGESGQTRDRFVQRVEAMLDAEGIPKGNNIPPVPKLPEQYANGGQQSNATTGRNWNRF